MDENLETKLRKLAEENGVDPDELIALAEQSGLPEGLDRVAETLLGDVALFGHALDSLKKEQPWPGCSSASSSRPDTRTVSVP